MMRRSFFDVDPLPVARRGRAAYSGMGLNVGQELVKGIIGTVGTRREDVPAPMDLYNEAAPRVIRILQQYDAAAPGIDFATKYWWLIALASFGLGVASSYAALALYNRKPPRKKTR